MYIDEATELESMLLARDPSTIVDDELREKYWNLREMEDESMEAIEMNDEQITVEEFMKELYDICEWRYHDSYIHYDADEMFDLNKMVSVILFGAKKGDGVWIKSVIEDRLSSRIKDIEMCDDKDGLAWSYQANIGLYITFNETVSVGKEMTYLWNRIDDE